MSSEPTRPWSDADLASDSVSKRDLVTFLQENASNQFLLHHKLNGKFVNIVKNSKRDALVTAFLNLFETKSFRTDSDLPAETLTKNPQPASTTPNPKVEPAAEPSAESSQPELVRYTKIVLRKGDKKTFVRKGDTVSVKYTGRLEDGTVFDSNEDNKNKQPLRFKVGTGRVIRGWDEGLLTMSKGERAKLTIESEWAYGKGGMPAAKIPPNATLVFEVELVGVE